MTAARPNSLPGPPTSRKVESRRRDGARLAAAALASLVTAGCVSDPDQPSIWPPADFHLEARELEVGESGIRVYRSWHVWADGLACYRTAEDWLEESALPIPVYDRVAVYRLDPSSTRVLCRELDRRGVFGDRTPPGQLADPTGRHVVVGWLQSGSRGVASSLSAAAGRMDRVVHLINSFLPEGEAFAFDGLGGMVEPPRVRGAPTPIVSASGSLRCHERLLEAHASWTPLFAECLVLALRSDELELARRMLAAIEQTDPEPDALAEFVDWERDVVAPLRAAIRAREEARREGA